MMNNTMNNNVYDKEKEVREAIQAGQRALLSLSNAEQYLNSARGWGTWDMFGGGIFSSMMKHSKMEEAQQSIEQAQRALLRFNQELKDVQMRGNIQINFDGVTKFLDIFCDNILIDIMVQSQIKETQQNVAATKEKVREAIRKLESL